jgi:hypothetical protein
MGVFKNFKISERFRLKFDVQVFNLFNRPSFDTPNNNVEFNPAFNIPPQSFPPFTAPQQNCPTNNGWFCPPNGELGLIQHTIGSPRFLPIGLHRAF